MSFKSFNNNSNVPMNLNNNNNNNINRGTRKTYSFEEREILVNLIAKYLKNGDNEEMNKGTMETTTLTLSSGLVVPKRKSAWSQVTEEYNALVGSENARSSVQLRRCWENMKANKKNRDDKRYTFYSFFIYFD